MPIPVKVPIQYAFAKLNETARGFPRLERINYGPLYDIAHDGLIQVTLLKPFFASHQDYMQFKRQIYVPHKYWQRVVNESVTPHFRAYAKRQMKVNPSRSASNSPRGSVRGSPAASPRHSRAASPVRKKPKYRKGELNMAKKLGRMSNEEYNDAPSSALSIQPSGDECDDSDVNLPLPVCQAFNKVCRTYNSSRQYIPYRPDGSERKNYDIKIKTKRNRG